jgi:hypothetical protein
MGMSEQEFWDSCPIFFNELAALYYKEKAATAQKIAEAFNGR